MAKTTPPAPPPAPQPVPAAAVAPPPPPPPPAPAPAPAAAPAPAPIDTSAFTYDDGLPIPAGRAFGATNGETKILVARLAAMPTGKSWLDMISVATDFGDDAARVKEYARLSKASFNRIGSAIKSVHKTQPNASYSVRKVATAELGYGVRVWRNADAAAATAAPAA